MHLFLVYVLFLCFDGRKLQGAKCLNCFLKTRSDLKYDVVSEIHLLLFITCCSDWFVNGLTFSGWWLKHVIKPEVLVL